MSHLNLLCKLFSSVVLGLLTLLFLNSRLVIKGKLNAFIMSLTGLLILTSPVHSLATRIKTLLASAAEIVNKTLYIQLHLGKQHSSFQSTSVNTDLTLSRSKVINMIYSNAYVACGSLDVRILIDNLKYCQPIEKRKMKFNVDVILTDNSFQNKDLKHYLKHEFLQNMEDLNVVRLLPEGSDVENNIKIHENSDGSQFLRKEYDNVVLGGTFDRLHVGHKIFLSEAAIRCVKQLTVGVTDETMLSQKILSELIEPTSVRIAAVNEFLTDVDPCIKYKVVPISDPFGPSIEDPSLECIVVSEETFRGGLKVNEKREKKEMNPLDILTIKLVEDDKRAEEEEFKISSSSIRMRLLGKRLRPPQVNHSIPGKPYIIGFTGGIASGKSSICNHLKTLGAAVIHSDQLAHSAYSRGTEAHHQIIAEFGEHILTSNGEINRKELGKLVFANPEKLEKLNSIVWPEVQRSIKKEIDELSQRKEPIVIIELPLLIESGMNKLVHEIWVSLIPRNEAVKRIQERDKLSEEQAEQRINSQMSNKERVSHANVIFSTLWEPQYTKKQVETAWSELNQFLQTKET